MEETEGASLLVLRSISTTITSLTVVGKQQQCTTVRQSTHTVYCILQYLLLYNYFFLVQEIQITSSSAF